MTTQPRKPLRIGLTGGIGAGKTSVAKLFAEQGAPVLSADEAARAVVRPGSPLLERVRKAFGSRILSDNGELNRPAMRAIVFGDADARRRLEAILHPAIRDHLRQQIGAIHAPYLVIEIPLLVESDHGIETDRVLVVTSPQSQRVDRVGKRDQIDSDAVHAIIHSQATDDERAAHADDIIANDGTRKALAEKVTELDRLYRQLAASREEARE